MGNGAAELCLEQSDQERILHSLTFCFAFLPILPHLLLGERASLPVKISVPKEVTLGCAIVLNYFCFAFFALLQVAWENHSRTVSYGSQHDQHYLTFKNLHLQTPCLVGRETYRIAFNSPENCSHQLLFVGTSRE